MLYVVQHNSRVGTIIAAIIVHYIHVASSLVSDCTGQMMPNCSEAQTQWMDVITQWKKSDLDASWEGLAGALGMIEKQTCHS